MNYMLTNKGLDLNAKLQSSTGATLKLTGAKGGVGYTVNPGELEDLLNIKQNLQLEEVQQDGNTVTYVIVLSNVGNDEEYVLTQIGLYAEDPDTGEEILYIIGQDSRGERIPAISESQVEYKFNVSQKISNASAVIFDTSPSDFTTKKVFEELRTKFDGHVDDTKNPHGVTAEQAGAAPKEHTHGVKDIIEIMPLSKGGTGASTAEDARANMGAAAVNHSHQVKDIPFANNLITTAAGFLLDARQGKVLDEKISVSKAMVSDAYDVDADYAVGDYCIYDNVLHRCIEAVAAGSGWTPTAWMETSIEQELSTLNNNMGGLSFYEDSAGNKYVVGADSVPKKLGNQIIRLGSTTSYNVSGYSGYNRFTKDNFLVDFVSLPFAKCSDNDNRGTGGTTEARGCTLSKTYNPSTGIFSLSGVSQTVYGANGNGSWQTSQNVNFVVYLVP